MKMYVDMEVDAPRIRKIYLRLKWMVAFTPIIPLHPGSSELWIAVRGEVGFIASR